MFAFLLALTWLVMTPVCVWLLFGRGHRGALRAAGALILVTLQAATMVLAFAHRPPMTPAQSVAVRDHRAGDDVPAGGPAGVPAGQGASAAQETPRPAVTPPSPACDSRVASPEAVRLSFRGRALHGLTLYWPASPAQCDTATVAVHRAGHRLRIWVSEGTATPPREGTRHVPVRVVQGMASLSLRLTPIVRHHRRYVAVDGHTGDRIPLRSPAS